jgi:hypothetical protein
MRDIMLVVLLGGGAFGQSLVEYSTAAAGGSAAGVAGKKVGEGISAIFGKVDKQTAKAAKTDKRDSKDNTPIIQVGPGVAKSLTESVPPPPPVRKAVAHKPAPKPAPAPEVAPPPPPPPPEVTAEDLKRVSAGTNRDALLQLGAPAARITMFDDGHLVEIYRYMA